MEKIIDELFYNRWYIKRHHLRYDGSVTFHNLAKEYFEAGYKAAKKKKHRKYTPQSCK